MTASEFAFLAMGLVLGIAAGAALIQILRARPTAGREVRVTVAQDAIPRRAATLADDAFLDAAEPARGGPADRRGGPIDPPAGSPDDRTPVRATPPVPVAIASMAATTSVPARAPAPTAGEPVGVPVRGGDDPLLAALRASAAATAVAAMRTGEPGTDRRSSPVAVASGERPSATTAGSGTGGTPSPGAPDRVAMTDGGPTSGDPASGDPAGGTMAGDTAGGAAGTSAAPRTEGACADERRLADERCELAVRARAGAAAADERLRAVQRDYDEHESRADRAAATADPRAVRRAKDEAQGRFRAARSSAATTEAVEAAARTWLLEINKINADAREASAALTRERESVRSLTLDLDRVAMEAEAARIAAETAESACLAARESLAACEEAAAGLPDRHPDVHPPAPIDVDGGEDEPLAAAFGSGGTPRIFRLVRGDRAAMIELVDAMAGDDPVQRRHWQLTLSDLLDAILADSIAAAILDFPSDHPFWSPFTVAQDRDIAQALASLGYRFDGLGGWVDGRVPSQRDLSLALGYAGLDPMRIRHWPNEAEMAELYAEVTVAADERLAGAAGDLTLGELVSMLGRRADSLADVWNHWGRLRPLLLEEG